MTTDTDISKGYLITAITEEDQRLASACAYSIKVSNPAAQIALVVPDVDKVYPHYQRIFDYVVQFTFTPESNRRVNDWQVYWSTPFEYNIVVDSLCLVHENHDHTWDRLIEHYDLAFNSYTVDHRGITNLEENKFYAENEVISVDTSMWYFRKGSDQAYEYFKVADPIFREWKNAFDNIYKTHYRTADFDADMIHSVCLHMLWDNNWCYTDDVFSVVKMTNPKWTYSINTWTQRNGVLKLQNYNIFGTFSYINPAFMTQAIYDHYQELYSDRNK